MDRAPAYSAACLLRVHSPRRGQKVYSRTVLIQRIPVFEDVHMRLRRSTIGGMSRRRYCIVSQTCTVDPVFSHLLYRNLALSKREIDEHALSNASLRQFRQRCVSRRNCCSEHFAQFLQKYCTVRCRSCVERAGGTALTEHVRTSGRQSYGRECAVRSGSNLLDAAPTLRYSMPSRPSYSTPRRYQYNVRTVVDFIYWTGGRAHMRNLVAAQRLWRLD
ncbi:hypothetical protein BCV69DRAFT_83079 [Microstroma glucosiphilum]|uniref:Uncharacterized protein n=1 Tax=Pseudomicrostroma glucosiphilum TaxID=1684307 RepID=A0A316U5W8_9BASI|nr:hypothetical protein BCV69DRAFT_83079 [Pseudomicrostroma glucosiphilum]PWN18355.1 hypothetical protein BCV69DRAFT_83079 [Pseudomicrostroma glucosiphilum]